ncbi:MAG TPA: DUF4142 domain-containing protein [Acidobacteriaceae bacterium]
MLRRTFMVAAVIAGLVPMALAQLSNTDKSFLNKAARGNNYEIQAAKLAQSMSTNDAYKTYAQMMIDDHTQAAQQLGAAVSQADPSFQLPTGVSPAQQTELDTLKNAKNYFDVKYRQQMIQSHAMMHNLFQDYLKGANNNAAIKAVITNLQPVVEKHWDAAKKLPKQ